ncbi:hypothetical protein FOCG_13618 [Fusarium oxysporum f. sp. radicis-lycopersici 26381]|uniref:Glucose repressible protein Grg1 n=3 Tax=Fusarium oxysporum TaxID=5507 RepID=A0A0J9UH60_FUSO4|nr:hypothetical protein FOXG_03009 [Fusarium oxysporum f. sp. lycopersici 4287]EWZ40402.1 hypothetical protein FOZG_09097 [Fusarium oxysporum Fo47]EXK33905.1 hypothetical protein FOMG_11107 [Fusarium oxysporum f. sp. melonis 26406]EXL44678.1 hypothetical protein FOCG_13618 [Fusarium oxysporum f. sp. radicis-lycopersici 26381]KAJ0156875.1 hypothetical protein HZ326_0975 [Fusarium oxysporum f. sp. albedinis]KAJ9420937.1 hypothetical protein QL093DRAFT_2344436 [Fusarium oxysporum]
MESLKQAGNYVAETVQQATSGASKEANKEVAKDGNVPISTRATAAKDALGDKIDETTHDKKADVSPQLRSIRLHETNRNRQVHKEAI